ncbi:MAG: hypothetical protein WAK02_02155, partial [Terriglobales bacterium]
RSNLALGKLAHALLQVQLLFIELEIQETSIGPSRFTLACQGFVILTLSPSKGKNLLFAIPPHLCHPERSG